jgi:hypothetical protein
MVYALKHVAVWVLVALPLSACGKSPSAPTPTTVVGTWTGTVTQTQPHQSYATTMVLSTSQSGTIEYGAPASCGGTLSGPGGGGPTFTFTERITHGFNCINGGTVTATVTGNVLSFHWAGSGLIGTGTLTRK